MTTAAPHRITGAVAWQTALAVESAENLNGFACTDFNKRASGCSVGACAALQPRRAATDQPRARLGPLDQGLRSAAVPRVAPATQTSASTAATITPADGVAIAAVGTTPSQTTPTPPPYRSHAGGPTAAPRDPYGRASMVSVCPALLGGGSRRCLQQPSEAPTEPMTPHQLEIAAKLCGGPAVGPQQSTEHRRIWQARTSAFLRQGAPGLRPARPSVHRLPITPAAASAAPAAAEEEGDSPRVSLSQPPTTPASSISPRRAGDAADTADTADSADAGSSKLLLSTKPRVDLADCVHLPARYLAPRAPTNAADATSAAATLSAAPIASGDADASNSAEKSASMAVANTIDGPTAAAFAKNAAPSRSREDDVLVLVHPGVATRWYRCSAALAARVPMGAVVIVEGDRGSDAGVVVELDLLPDPAALDMVPLRVLRVGRPDDVERFLRNQERAAEVAAFTARLLQRAEFASAFAGLVVQGCQVQHAGCVITIFYSAPRSVRFKSLLRPLTHRYHGMRIWLVQTNYSFKREDQQE